MKERYGLNELWIPEDRHLEEEYRHLPRCNIFMTDDFLPGSAEGIRKKAFVLIQGTGAVRAG